MQSELDLNFSTNHLICISQVKNPRALVYSGLKSETSDSGYMLMHTTESSAFHYVPAYVGL